MALDRIELKRLDSSDEVIIWNPSFTYTCAGMFAWFDYADTNFDYNDKDQPFTTCNEKYDQNHVFPKSRLVNPALGEYKAVFNSWRGYDAKISIELLTPSREKRENKFLIRQINERIKKLDDECLVLEIAKSTLIDRIEENKKKMMTSEPISIDFNIGIIKLNGEKEALTREKVLKTQRFQSIEDSIQSKKAVFHTIYKLISIIKFPLIAKLIDKFKELHDKLYPDQSDIIANKRVEKMLGWLHPATKELANNPSSNPISTQDKNPINTSVTVIPSARKFCRLL